MNSLERGKFIEVLRPYSDKDKRTRWQRGLIIGIGPGVVTEQGRKYTLNEHDLLVKISNGHATPETVAILDRRQDNWKVLFR